MTGLNRTDLPTSLKVQLAAGGLALQSEYGAITTLSEKYKVSRPTVYSAARTAEKVLERHFEQSGAHFVQTSVEVDYRQLERTIIALRTVAPNSIRAIENLLPILYPGCGVSYGSIQSILSVAEQKAAEFNKSVDLTGIEAGALDEMFSQGSPVLAGVDLDSSFLFALALRESRSGTDWAEVLQESNQQNLELQKVVKDAAKGIKAGVDAVYPDAEQRDDCFHAIYEMGKVHQILERKAYGKMTRVEEIESRIEDAKRNGRGNRRKLGQQLRAANNKCTEALELHDDFESAMREVLDAMEFIDLATAQIRTAPQMESLIKEAAAKMKELPNEKCLKVGKYIYNRAEGLALYMNELNQALCSLAERYGDTPTRLASLIFRLSSDLRNNRRPWSKHEDKRYLLGALAMLHETAKNKTDELLTEVGELMQKRHRASSAIEGFNAALRPFLYVQKGVTDGFLELFRAHYNLRTKRWGRHKGTSAYESLTGHQVSDWLSFIGYPPSTIVH